MSFSNRIVRLLLLVILMFLSVQATAAERLKVLIIDGQNNHEWQVTTPIMKRYFEQSERFVVDVATSPPAKHDLSKFRPKFKDYDLVVSNYNGEAWSKEMQEDFQAYVYNGGGFVSVHAANNSFADWPEYNVMIGLGGWNKRNEKSGPYVYYRDGAPVRDDSAGRGGSHGSQHEFLVTIREPEHPITRGLPLTWLHTQDELYDQLRGPAKSMKVLATAYADPEERGSGRDEPMLMTIDYGAGRVFHTTLGHADYSMECVGFITTLLRGSEWVATGAVTIEVPKDFPTAEKSSSRKAK